MAGRLEAFFEARSVKPLPPERIASSPRPPSRLTKLLRSKSPLPNSPQPLRIHSALASRSPASLAGRRASSPAAVVAEESVIRERQRFFEASELPAEGAGGRASLLSSASSDDSAYGSNPVSQGEPASSSAQPRRTARPAPLTDERGSLEAGLAVSEDPLADDIERAYADIWEQLRDFCSSQVVATATSGPGPKSAPLPRGRFPISLLESPETPRSSRAGKGLIRAVSPLLQPPAKEKPRASPKRYRSGRKYRQQSSAKASSLSSLGPLEQQLSAESPSPQPSRPSSRESVYETGGAEPDQHRLQLISRWDSASKLSGESEATVRRNSSRPSSALRESLRVWGQRRSADAAALMAAAEESQPQTTPSPGRVRSLVNRWSRTSLTDQPN